MRYRMNTFVGILIMLAVVMVGIIVNFESALFGGGPHSFLNMVGTVIFIIGWFFFIFACQENITLLKILCAVGIYSVIFGLLGYFQYGGWFTALFALPIGLSFCGVDYWGIHPYLAMAVVSFVMSALSFWVLIDAKKEIAETKRLNLGQKQITE